MDERRAGSVELEGRVIEALPSALFRVELEGRKGQIVAPVAPHARRNFIRLLIGDRVIVELSPNDVTRGRITRRCSS